MNARDDSGNADIDAPVTAIFKRRVKSGRETDFLNWSRRITAVCRTFDGYVSTKLIEPVKPNGDYVTVVTFDNFRHYQQWEESEKRQQLLEGMQELIDGEVSQEQIVGLYQFLGKEEKKWPPDWRMVLVAYAAIWPLVHFIPPLINPWLPEQSLVQSLLSTAVITILMGYVSLPLMEALYRKLRG